MVGIYEIPGPPVAWTSHRGFGKKSFNPHYKEKEAAKWALKIQHQEKPLHEKKLRVDFCFEMPIPQSLSKKIIKRIQEGQRVYHDKRPDATNLRKHAEDCLVGSVIQDDNIVCSGETQKYYAKGEPKTVIFIEEMENG